MSKTPNMSNAEKPEWVNLEIIKFFANQRDQHIRQISDYTGKAVFAIVVAVFSVSIAKKESLIGDIDFHWKIILLICSIIAAILIFKALVDLSTHNSKKIKVFENLMSRYSPKIDFTKYNEEHKITKDHNKNLFQINKVYSKRNKNWEPYNLVGYASLFF